MRKRSLLILAVSSCALGLLWMCCAGSRGAAEGEAKYVGSKSCATCHSKVYKQWALTAHRPTLFNKDQALQGCEACHGPGAEHADGTDRAKIIAFPKLKPDQVATICMKCHNEEHVTLWRSSLHARSKLSCINCHDPHSPDSRTLLKFVENGKLDLEGLTRTIERTQLQANTAPEGSKEKAAANEALVKLNAEDKALREGLKANETAYKRVAEPYLCYNCHKTQQVRCNMASHHPIVENKMVCSDCHNPHGGPNGMLKEESVNETCFKCHAEKLGPFTFEHPPVAEDCTICHNPHGSPQDHLLVQRQPFLCLRCHAGPHSRPVQGVPGFPAPAGLPALKSPATISEYYVQCTSCHAQIHGSDEHAAFHF